VYRAFTLPVLPVFKGRDHGRNFGYPCSRPEKTGITK